MTEPNPGTAVRVEVTDTWSAFLNFTAWIAEGVFAPFPAYAFRGQGDSEWNLQPSLARLAVSAGLDAQTTLEIEASARRDFQTVAHLHLPNSMIPDDDNLLVWWSLMQHYGAPTRLLDWTHSPFVAAYFACERYHERPGAVWTVHGHSVNTFMGNRLGFSEAIKEGTLLRADAPPVVYLPHLSRVTDRMRAQQTCSSVSTRILADHDSLLREAFGGQSGYSQNAVVFMKAIIPAERKLDFLFRLRSMNITAQSLFPGIDGLGRSVGELVRLGAHRALRLRQCSAARRLGIPAVD